MAQSSFVVGATTVLFNWLDRGPQYSRANNTEYWSGRILLTTTADVAALAALWREIYVQPVDASSGLGFVVDYNGPTNPSGTFTESDAGTHTAVLTKFHRTVWGYADFNEVEVEFTKVA